MDNNDQDWISLQLVSHNAAVIRPIVTAYFRRKKTLTLLLTYLLAYLLKGSY